MNSIALLGLRPRDDRYGIVRVVGRHVVAVQQILQQHTRDRHAVGERDSEKHKSGEPLRRNCSDYTIKKLGCQCATVCWRENAKERKRLVRKELFFRGLFAQLPALEWDDNHQKRRMLRLRGA